MSWIEQDLACHNVGFAFIINHGSKRVFDLKTEEKMLVPDPDGPIVHRGYSWPSLEKVSQVISENLEVGEQSRQLAEGPGLKDPEFLLKFHLGHNNQLRLLYYPPIPAAQLENESSARMPAHSDFNDYLKSTLRRVTLLPAPDWYTGADRMTQTKYSIPYFVSPEIDSRIECILECASESNPVKYEPVVQPEYRLMRAKLQYPERVSQPITACVWSVERCQAYRA
ncbi:Clavaminate synthase-like protein [Hyaloscypha bicolor E]|uniref:Clavaminate synthase-like protein n=1 Tax=Hyaloscypha bicolor E TaxID=1095630 RepID=A0A2J6SNZ1_9HELO|nr:Clavaminate synthase-like protein [Hyaloscypha bicolor E]PMD52491.1 Clavaminate synthase-like protein [Hyaloscypha bicolor E]